MAKVADDQTNSVCEQAISNPASKAISKRCQGGLLAWSKESWGGEAERPEGLAQFRSARLRGFDVMRGFSVISMVLFHFCYDLVYLWGAPLPWFASPLQDVWRSSISWIFLILAGIMCSYSRNNLKRGLRYLALALVIYLATLMAQVDTPISFGIIYCMGFSTLAVWGLQRLGLGKQRGWRSWLLASVLVGLFLLMLDAPDGRFGLSWLGGPSVSLPASLYASGHLSWIGFPGPRFASGDYYPPLPFSLLFIAAYVWWCASGHEMLKDCISKMSCKPLEWLGCHPLSIYVLHQPILLGLSYLVAKAMTGA